MSDEELAEVEEHPAKQGIVEKNIELLKKLQTMGADVNPLQIMQIRLMQYIDLFLPGGTPLREFYDFQVDRAVNQLLEQALSEVTRDRLTAGIDGMPKDIA